MSAKLAFALIFLLLLIPLAAAGQDEEVDAGSATTTKGKITITQTDYIVSAVVGQPVLWEKKIEVQNDYKKAKKVKIKLPKGTVLVDGKKKFKAPPGYGVWYVHYKSPAPTQTEQVVTDTDRFFISNITVSSDFTSHYYNTTTSMLLPNLPKTWFFWVQQTNQTGTYDIPATPLDTDDDGLYDLLTWNVPKLSQGDFQAGGGQVPSFKPNAKRATNDSLPAYWFLRKNPWPWAAEDEGAWPWNPLTGQGANIKFVIDHYGLLSGDWNLWQTSKMIYTTPFPSSVLNFTIGFTYTTDAIAPDVPGYCAQVGTEILFTDTNRSDTTYWVALYNDSVASDDFLCRSSLSGSDVVVTCDVRSLPDRRNLVFLFNSICQSGTITFSDFWIQ